MGREGYFSVSLSGMKYTFKKQERLKSKKLIEKLFEEGSSIKKFPVRLMYLQTEHSSDFPVQVSFSVPKRNFKKAVQRNRIKRLLRESYRLEKHKLYENLDQPFIFMITFIGKENPEYVELQQKIQQILTLFIKAVKKNETHKTNKKQ